MRRISIKKLYFLKRRRITITEREREGGLRANCFFWCHNSRHSFHISTYFGTKERKRTEGKKNPKLNCVANRKLYSRIRWIAPTLFILYRVYIFLGYLFLHHFCAATMLTSFAAFLFSNSFGAQQCSVHNSISVNRNVIIIRAHLQNWEWQSKFMCRISVVRSHRPRKRSQIHQI